MSALRDSDRARLRVGMAVASLGGVVWAGPVSATELGEVARRCMEALIAEDPARLGGEGAEMRMSGKTMYVVPLQGEPEAALNYTVETDGLSCASAYLPASGAAPERLPAVLGELGFRPQGAGWLLCTPEGDYHADTTGYGTVSDLMIRKRAPRSSSLCHEET